MNFDESSRILRALSDGTRLRILNLLSEGELCVCDLIRVLDEPQSKISRHLGYLRRAGLAAGRKEGLWMHYKLSTLGKKMFQSIFSGFSCRKTDFKELRRDLQALKDKKKSLAAGCYPS